MYKLYIILTILLFIAGCATTSVEDKTLDTNASAKKIIVCIDGTWNTPTTDDNNDGIPDPTNVWKTYNAIKSANDPNVRIFYLPGVGTSGLINKITGGATGAGIVDQILKAMAFIVDNYRANDEIYILGFSRGAYASRILADVIVNVGMPRYSSKPNLIHTWNKYIDQYGSPSNYGKLRRIKRKIVGFFGSDDLQTNIEVSALFLFDTVSAIGLPKYKDEQRIDTYATLSNDLDPNIHFAYHAVSIDEKRADFKPELINPRNNVIQMWFTGAHSDIGGGYAQTSLSDISLLWMLDQLSTYFTIAPPRTSPNIYADIHQPWLDQLYKNKPKITRVIPQEDFIHNSVTKRYQQQSTNLPENLRNFQELSTKVIVY